MTAKIIKILRFVIDEKNTLFTIIPNNENSKQ